ncbi:Benzoate 4-monooxygenase [Cytospora mali]|uniref:Benzoate 4-monooxygenase n=1 Tax=Cytospora mali TaxID=578113 RepID=A0A194W9Y0_CYTMA|nr:Benzoate 4-monooxygenase [Valsa mali]
MHGITDGILHTVLQHWFAVLIVAVSAWLLRNRFHNGLNKYPGPFMASLTDWWRLVDVWNRRPELTHIKLHEKHGDVVRLGPNTLSFADPAALKAIYGLNKGYVKSSFYVVQQSVVKGHSLQSLFSTVDNDFHQQFRRCVNSAFAMSALVQYEPFVDNTTKLFLKQTERLFANNPQGCDFTRWLQFYAFDVIGEITYSKRHGFVEKNEDIDGIVAYLTSLFNYVAPVSHQSPTQSPEVSPNSEVSHIDTQQIGQIPILDRLFLKNPIYLKLSEWGVLDATFPVAKFARARMAERLPDISSPSEKANSSSSSSSSSILPTAEKKDSSRIKPAPTVDLLSKFLAAKEARPGFMTDTLVQTMAVSMAFAGSETTAISLGAVFYYLLRTPHAMARLRAELDGAGRRGAFGDNETGLVTWHESQGLEYLDVCIKEAFRLHPAPGLPMERIVPPQGAEIAGRFVPGGTIVGCSAWVLHRNRDIFGEDVDVYRPERWLVDETKDRAKEEARIKEMTGTMLQFGMGSRTCIGKNISLLEIYKLVPSLLRRFEINFQDPSKDWKICNSWFVKQTDFFTSFSIRDIPQPEMGASLERSTDGVLI